MKKSVILFLVVASSLFLVVAFYTLTASDIANSSWAQESSEQDDLLKKLNFLRRIAGAEREARITSTAEIHKASIRGLDGTEIPDSLTTDFDRIYTMVVHYLNLGDKGERIVDWVMAFDALQGMLPGKEACPGGCPTVLAALYIPLFDWCCFTPRYADDYYVTHELLHYFIDEYEDAVIEGLPEVISEQNQTGLPLGDFLKQNEEEIVINLAQIIIRESSTGFVLKESRCVCEPEIIIDIPGNVSCTCVKPPEEMIANKDIDCKGCHGTEEIGKFVSQEPLVSSKQ